MTGRQFWRVEVLCGELWTPYGGRPFARISSALDVAHVALCQHEDGARARVYNVGTGEVWELRRLKAGVF